MAQVQMDTTSATAIEPLTVILQRVLSETAFANRMLIAPRRIREIGAAEASYFTHYMLNPDQAAALAHGRDLAQNGLGHSSVLRLASTLRSFSWNAAVSDPAEWFRFAQDYTLALVEGYMQGREEELRLEQERTRAAYLRTLQE